MDAIFRMLLLFALWTPLEVGARVTWYGGRDVYLGKRHAASWNGETPAGFPEVVTTSALGCAAPYWIPFGSVVRLTRWDGEREYRAYAIVVDRTASGETWDVWPAVAKDLGFGPSFGKEDRGAVNAVIEIYGKTEVAWTH